MLRKGWCLAGALVVGISSTLGASAAWAQEEPDSECPILFGHAEDVEQRQLHRASVVNFVQAGEPYIVLAHSGHYEEPDPVHFTGIELVSVDPAEARATIELDAEAAGVDCPSGAYEFSVDDAFGPDGAVLAIVDDVVLLEVEGEFRYLSIGDRTELWSMAWVSPWAINPYRPRPGGVVRAPPRAQPARRR